MRGVDSLPVLHQVIDTEGVFVTLMTAVGIVFPEELRQAHPTGMKRLRGRRDE